MEPITPSFTHLPQFVTPQVYAELCGIRVAGVYHRHSMGHIAGIRISGNLFIDVDVSPPQARLERNAPQAPPMQWPAGLPAASELICLVKWANTNRANVSDVFTDILFGKVQAWGIGGHVVVRRSADTANGKLLKRRGY
jgi:hypothetical protein